MAHDLSPLAEAYLRERSVAQPSKATARARRSDLARIGEIMRDLAGLPVEPGSGELLPHLTTDHLTPDDVIAAFAVLAETRAASTVRRVQSTWRGFCTWLVTRKEVLARDPMGFVDTPRGRGWVPKPISDDDLARVVAAVRREQPHRRAQWVALELAVCSVLVGGGLRRQEICDLKVGDLHRSTESMDRLVVTGKGGKTRAVPLPPEVVAIIDAYLAERTEALSRPGPDDPMFVRATERALSPDAVYRMVGAWFRAAGVRPPPGAMVHSLRHTTATALVAAGASMPEVASLLGHASVSTTQAYVEVAARGVESAAMSNPARRLLGPDED